MRPRRPEVLIACSSVDGHTRVIARWKPRHLAVFAGKLDYGRYGWRDRSIIRLIMLLTGGPTDPSACVEYTDWAKVHAFGERVAAMSAIAERHR